MVHQADIIKNISEPIPGEFKQYFWDCDFENLTWRKYSFPQWLNSLAEKEGINFSNLLQSALKKKLRI